ncbi:hypothetical protein [Pseudoruegeria sp. HB172150]|uniref:phage tail terminator protein n=1 Tax=Pseudoruegeria sp. HB172150 TaxID=2721164 RepID=UPI001551EFB7|nr:hypothetical protein [Pseudoruegeria sp. HB172150]
MIDAVVARIEAQVAALNGRTQPVAAFAELQRNNALPQVTPAAHVVPLGFRGGAAEAATGFYMQAYDNVVGVLLYVRAHDQTGGRHLGDIETLINAVIGAICGWAPADEVGVFTLLRGAMINVASGLMVFQIDFAITDQLRIAS